MLYTGLFSEYVLFNKVMPKRNSLKVKIQACQHKGLATTFGIAQAEEIINLSIEGFRQLMKRQKQLKSRPIPNFVQSFSGKFTQWDLGISKIRSFHRHRINRFKKQRKIIKLFGPNDLCLLVWIVNNYMALHMIPSFIQMKRENWQVISAMIPYSAWQSCMYQILSLKKVNAWEYKWTKEQSEILFQIATEADNEDLEKWKKISLELYLRNPSEKIFRNIKQCRQHYSILVCPNTYQLKVWDQEEDIILLNGYIYNQHKKEWAKEIHHLLNQRTSSSLRSRLVNLLRRQEEKQHKSLTKVQLASIALNSIFTERPDLKASFEQNNLSDKNQENFPVKLQDCENQDCVNYFVSDEETSRKIEIQQTTEKGKANFQDELVTMKDRNFQESGILMKSHLNYLNKRVEFEVYPLFNPYLWSDLNMEIEPKFFGFPGQSRIYCRKNGPPPP